MAISNTIKKVIELRVPHSARILFVAISVLTSSATTVVLAEDIPINEREWHVLYVRDYNVPVYEYPSRQSKVVARLGKGDTVSNYIRRGAGRRWEEMGWFNRRARPTSEDILSAWKEHPGGWVETRHLIHPKDFKHVTSWPFRFLVVDRGGISVSRSFCFSEQGVSQSFIRTEGQDDIARANVKPSPFKLYSADDILVHRYLKYGLIGSAIALYDRKNVRLCPIGLTDKECDQVVKDAGNVWMFALFSDESELAKERYSKYCLGKPYVPGTDPFKDHPKN